MMQTVVGSAVVGSAEPVTSVRGGRAGEHAAPVRHAPPSAAFAQLLLGRIAALPEKVEPRAADRADARSAATPPTSAPPRAEIRSSERRGSESERPEGQEDASDSPATMPGEAVEPVGAEDPLRSADPVPVEPQRAGETDEASPDTEAGEALAAPLASEPAAPTNFAAAADAGTGKAILAGGDNGGPDAALPQEPPTGSVSPTPAPAAGEDPLAATRAAAPVTPAAVPPRPEPTIAASPPITTADAGTAAGGRITPPPSRATGGPEGGALSVVREPAVLISQPASALAPQAVAAIAPQPATAAAQPSASPAAAGRDRPLPVAPGVISGGANPAAAAPDASTAVPAAAPPVPFVAAARSPQAAAASMGSELRATPNAGPAPQAAAMAGSAVAEGASGNPAAFASAVPGKAAPAAELRRPTLAGQVSVHISKALRDGTDRIDIQLKPASLGRVDVRLEITPDGRVHAAITADSRHALDLLRGDSRELERALQDAGFKADSGSLSFGLRGQDERQAHGGGGTAAANQAVAEDGEASDEPADDAESPANIAGFPAGRLDIRA